ncbi:GNAT family N-acetyltransferase [Streptomyces sp. NPDC046985]|uniref:GNAT family N-acetyltransferase n=1 Tax=Streptomyces sp. NPDC046985 TaxID=3155377 RepID=UPI0033CE6A45
MTPFPGGHGDRAVRHPSRTGSAAGRPPGKAALEIRGVTETDLPDVLRLDREAFPDGPYPYFALRQFHDALGDHLLVVDDGRALHGYVLATPPHRAASWILSLTVSPALRGNGVGRELMTEMLGRLRAEGATEVLLTVDPANDSALTLYRALGFAPSGDVLQDYFGPGEPRQRMRLAL